MLHKSVIKNSFIFVQKNNTIFTDVKNSEKHKSNTKTNCKGFRDRFSSLGDSLLLKSLLCFDNRIV